MPLKSTERSCVGARSLGFVVALAADDDEADDDDVDATTLAAELWTTLDAEGELLRLLLLEDDVSLFGVGDGATAATVLLLSTEFFVRARVEA